MEKRKLASSYSVELYQDLQAMMGVNADKEIAELLREEMSTADGHIWTLNEKIKQLKNQKTTSSGFSKSHLETQINKVRYELDNHKELFPEYYL